MSSDQISPQARRWLDTIAYAEGLWSGQGPIYDRTFAYEKIDDLSRHPDRVITSNGISSSAAGAYQFLTSTWNDVKNSLGLRDFSPQSQDQAALELIRRKGVDPDKDQINRTTVAMLSPTWASLPNLEGKSQYNQPVKKFKDLAQFARSRGESPSEPATTTTPTTPTTPTTSTSTAKNSTQSKKKVTPTPEQKTAIQNLYNLSQFFTDLIRGGDDDELKLPEPEEISPAQMVMDQEKDTQALLKDIILDRSKALREEEKAKQEIQANVLSNAAQSKRAAANMMSLAMEAFRTPGSPI